MRFLYFLFPFTQFENQTPAINKDHSGKLEIIERTPIILAEEFWRACASTMAPGSFCFSKMAELQARGGGSSLGVREASRE